YRFVDHALETGKERIGIFDKCLKPTPHQPAEVAIALRLVEGILGRAWEQHGRAGSFDGVAVFGPRLAGEDAFFVHVLDGLTLQLQLPEVEPSEETQQEKEQLLHGVEIMRYIGVRVVAPRLDVAAVLHYEVPVAGRQR